jgi:competence protein ComEA
MLGFTKTTSSKASDRLRLAMDQWKIQPPPTDRVTPPPAQRQRAVVDQVDSPKPGMQISWSPRSLKAFGAIAAALLVVLGFQWWNSQPGDSSSVTQGAIGQEVFGQDAFGMELPTGVELDTGLSTGVLSMDAGVTVHVAGAVKSPGLYQLPIGSRIADAIAAAGGTTKKSAADSVNLARELVDGEQILVGAQGTSGQVGISINSSSAEQLEELPGIGPVLAERIVDHRTAQGPFTAIDQLAEVSGIGDSVLEKIRSAATL